MWDKITYPFIHSQTAIKVTTCMGKYISHETTDGYLSIPLYGLFVLLNGVPGVLENLIP